MEEFKKGLRRFAEERDWEQFHTPKNLAVAVAVGTAEFVEILQWLTPAESEVWPRTTWKAPGMRLLTS